MPINAKELIGNVGNKITNAPIVKNVTKNPFYTAILISIIIILIILFVFRNVPFDKSDESLYKLSFRAGIYSLFIVTAIQFLQNQNVFNEVKANDSSSKIDDVFNKMDKPSGIVKLGGKESSDKAAEESEVSGNSDVFVPVGIDVSFI